jgi:lysophospholipid acyltransferase (LPLAT)-like uncharacterized protein
MFIVYKLITLYAMTWRIKYINFEQFDERRREGKGMVVALWHDQLLALTASQRGKGMATIASKSEDGEFIAGLLHAWNFEVARGSSSRGGAAALVSAKRLLKKGFHMAVTVDGPIGPRHKVKPGAIYLAKMANTEIVPAFTRFKWFVRFKSWDKFLLPLPFAYIEVELCQPVMLSTDMSANAIIADRQMLEKIMRSATSEVSPDFV